MAQRYHVTSGENLWDIARRTLPNMDSKKAVMAVFDLNWDILAKRFWVPAGVDLTMPPNFDPSANEPIDPSANEPIDPSANAPRGRK
jgi:hypothetical protein